MWNLTEPEQARLMEAVEAVIDPWREPVDSSYVWENPDGTRETRHIKVPGVSQDAPSGVRALNDVYEGIIGVGALTVPHD